MTMQRVLEVFFVWCLAAIVAVTAWSVAYGLQHIERVLTETDRPAPPISQLLTGWSRFEAIATKNDESATLMEGRFPALTGEIAATTSMLVLGSASTNGELAAPIWAGRGSAPCPKD